MTQFIQRETTMSAAKFTPISRLGEFKLIEKLVDGVSVNKKLTKLGIGDDAAVIPYLENRDYVISTDMLVEGVHFDSTYTPLKHLGYKSIVVSVSDICAMNGRATHALVSIAVPNKYSVEHIGLLYEGIKTACGNYGIDLIGGDTTSSSTGLVVSVTIIGEVESRNVTYRAGAKPNELLFVSGDLGAAYVGLQILEREKYIFDKNTNAQPELGRYEYILERQLRPEARIDIVDRFNKNQVLPSSMIDISDGLSSDAVHICNSSRVGVKIFEEKIPIAEATIKTANELNINPTICALHGGEDYELLFTAPIYLREKIESFDGVRAIGHITSKSEEVSLITTQGDVIDMASDGWDSFVKNKKHI